MMVLSGLKDDLIDLTILPVQSSSNSADDARRKETHKARSEKAKKSKRDKRRENDRQWKEKRRAQINNDIERLVTEIKRTMDSNAPGATSIKEALEREREEKLDQLLYLDSKYPKWTNHAQPITDDSEEEEKKRRRIRFDNIRKEETLEEVLGDIHDLLGIEVEEDECEIVKGPTNNQLLVLLTKESELTKLHKYKEEYGKLHRNAERRNKNYRAFVAVEYNHINLELLKKKIIEKTGEEPALVDFDNKISATFTSRAACESLCRLPYIKASEVQAVTKSRRITFKPSINNIYNNRYVLQAKHLPKMEGEKTIIKRLEAHSIKAIAVAKEYENNFGLIAFATPEDARKAIKIGPEIGDQFQKLELQRATQHEKHYYWNTEWIHKREKINLTAP